MADNANRIVVEHANNCYRFWHPYGFVIGTLTMPADGQYMIDSRAVAVIVKALEIRYKLK